MATVATEKEDLSASGKGDEKPIVSFGLITDIHYADLEDRWNYSNTYIRRYRNSLNLVDQACRYWLNAPHPIAFVLQLGDLIDGFCFPDKASESALKTILARFEKISPVYHLWGNHEFYNFTRDELLSGPLCSFDTRDISPCHYGTIAVTANLRIIALDTYDLSLLGVEKDSERYRQAMDALREHNQNENLNDRTGLAGCEQRFLHLNGGLTQKQLSWLTEQLTSARHHAEKVIVIGHIPIHPEACDEIALLWNYEDVLNVLWKFEDLVLAYIAGHCHEGGYFCDEKRIHHLTLPAIVECESDTNAFATVRVYKDYLIIDGVGRVDIRRIDFVKK